MTTGLSFEGYNIHAGGRILYSNNFNTLYGDSPSRDGGRVFEEKLRIVYHINATVAVIALLGNLKKTTPQLLQNKRQGKR